MRHEILSRAEVSWYVVITNSLAMNYIVFVETFCCSLALEVSEVMLLCRKLLKSHPLIRVSQLQHSDARDVITITYLEGKSNVQVIPRWFIESHSDKLREVVYLKLAGSTSGTWSVRVFIELKSAKTATLPDIKLRGGWNEFATFHGLVENDRLVFSLKAMSKFEVYIFHRTGEPKESCFLSTRKENEAYYASSSEAQEFPQQRLGYEESRQWKQAIKADSFPSRMPPFRSVSHRLFNTVGRFLVHLSAPLLYSYNIVSQSSNFLTSDR